MCTVSLSSVGTWSGIDLVHLFMETRNKSCTQERYSTLYFQMGHFGWRKTLLAGSFLNAYCSWIYSHPCSKKYIIYRLLNKCLTSKYIRTSLFFQNEIWWINILYDGFLYHHCSCHFISNLVSQNTRFLTFWYLRRFIMYYACRYIYLYAGISLCACVKYIFPDDRS